MKSRGKKPAVTLERQVFRVKRAIVESSYRARTGHIGSALSIADLVSVLYFSELRISARTVASNRRDRFILSKGHAAAALYATLHQKKILPDELFRSFAREEGGLCEHPEIRDPGVEMSTGSLGHGLAFGTGIALGLKRQRLDNRVFVLISDGECGEGTIWEAAQLAATHKLDNLTVIIDFNGWQCFGRSTEILALQPFQAKWEAFGFAAKTIDGHTIPEIVRTYGQLPFRKGKPSCIIANTVTGKGVAVLENTIDAHYKVLTDAEYRQAMEELQA